MRESRIDATIRMQEIISNIKSYKYKLNGLVLAGLLGKSECYTNSLLTDGQKVILKEHNAKYNKLSTKKKKLFY